MPDTDGELAILIDGCGRLGIELTPRQLEQLAAYRERLLGEATKLGISGIDDPGEVERRHLLESAALLRVLRDAGIALEGAALVDVGSGAGIPGLALQVLEPSLRVTLVESKAKAAGFLEATAAGLGLDGVTIVNARAEVAGRDPAHREQYDLATAKAVAPLPVLLELTLPFVRAGGWLVAPKGSEAQAEAAEAVRALAELGSEPRGIVGLPLAEPPQFVVLVEKTAPTPDRYPRRAGMPAKRPL
jgi:16S rRNA (guanine527-N7)-methyltransferase